MPETRDLTAALAEIRERQERLRSQYGHVGGLLALAGARDDVPRLLAAVEAVLARHVPKTVTVRHLCSKHGAGTGLSAPAREAGLSMAEMFAVIDACPDCVKQPVTECAACSPVCPDDSVWPCDDVQAISAALLGEDGGR